MTAFSDNFTRADADVLGGTWAVFVGSGANAVFGIRSNALAYVSGNNGTGSTSSATAFVDTGDSNIDMTVTGSVMDLLANRIGGPAFRIVDKDNFWYVDRRVSSSDAHYRLISRSLGITTVMKTSTVSSSADGDVIRIIATGTSIDVYVNTVLAFTNTVSSLQQTATKHGVHLGVVATAARFDNLSINVGGALPVNTVAPVISGTRVEGYTLSATTGTWSNTPTSYAYQWQREGSDIAGATSATYDSTSADDGLTVTCTVLASNANGPAAQGAVSNGLDIVAPMVIGDIQIFKAGVGLGGAIGTAIGSPQDLFDAVTHAEAGSGDTEYRGMYIKNAHEVQTLTSYLQWIVTQTTSTSTALAFGFAPESAGVSIQTIANESTAPTSVTFAAPADTGSATSGGNIGPGSYRGVWFRRTVTAAAPALADDRATIGWNGSPA